MMMFVIGVSLFIWCCFFFKQKTAYEMRISDWSSDVCSSDLLSRVVLVGLGKPAALDDQAAQAIGGRIVAHLNAVGEKEAIVLVDPIDGAKPGTSEIARSEERRVGKECGSTCRSRWWP